MCFSMYSLMSSWISESLVAEEQLGERLGELGLAHPGRAEEDERARRALRVLQAGPGAPDRPRERVDGVFLADDPLVELLLHPQELRRFLLGELVDRDPRPVRQHLGDDVFVDDVEQLDALGAPLLLEGGLPLEFRAFLLGELVDELQVVAGEGRVLLLADLRELRLDLLVLRRRRHAPDPQPTPRLVDEVDRLVRQVAVGDVPVGEIRRGDERLVGDRHVVVLLVAFAQPLEDLDRVRERRLLDLDRLEAAFEGGVLLEVLAVLVECRRADRLQFARGRASASGSTRRRSRPRRPRHRRACATHR